MEDFLGAIAFFALIAAQFSAVVAVNRMGPDVENAEQLERRPELKVDPRSRHLRLST